MEEARIPDIVFSLAGHDKGKAFIRIKYENGFSFLIDGKVRKLTNPKKKSMKHLALCKSVNPDLAKLIKDGQVTNRVIRNELARFCSEVGSPKEVNQLVKR